MFQFLGNLKGKIMAIFNPVHVYDIIWQDSEGNRTQKSYFVEGTKGKIEIDEELKLLFPDAVDFAYIRLAESIEPLK